MTLENAIESLVQESKTDREITQLILHALGELTKQLPNNADLGAAIRQIFTPKN